MLNSGVTVTVKVAHVRLCHSRMMFARAYMREGQRLCSMRMTELLTSSRAPSAALTANFRPDFDSFAIRSHPFWLHHWPVGSFGGNRITGKKIVNVIDRTDRSVQKGEMEMSTRHVIINAAAAIVASEGVRSLTMDAVAKAAGVSKGTIFYNFGSKEGLITAMVQELVDVTEARIEKSQSVDPLPGSWLRGFVNTSVRDETEAGALRNLSFAVIAAVAGDLKLLKPMEERQSYWRSKINSDGISAPLGHLIRLAADGMWFNDIAGMPAVDEQEREAVIDLLIQLTRQKPKEVE